MRYVTKPMYVAQKYTRRVKVEILRSSAVTHSLNNSIIYPRLRENKIFLQFCNFIIILILPAFFIIDNFIDVPYPIYRTSELHSIDEEQIDIHCYLFILTKANININEN